MLEKGYIQVYTGNGKGKSTAAYGIILRAFGNKMHVYCLQFMKDYPYSEKQAFTLLSEFVEVVQVGSDDFVFRKEYPNKNEREIAKSGLELVKEKMLSGKYDIIIIDEVCVAIYFKLLEEEEVIKLLDEKPENVEVILTGRYCPKSILEKADLVSEIMEVNHYYKKGILARRGIDS